MPNIKPLRDISEHDVLNGFYTWSGTIPVTKGTFAKISSGWSTETELAELGNVGAAYNNVVSQRVGLTTAVAQCTNSGDNAVGILLYDVRELDENGLPLKFFTEKQARMQCTLSGQSVVIAQRGKFLYSGVNGGATPVVGVSAGAPAYLANDGGINTSGSLTNAGVTKVGKFLGVPNAQGWVLVDIQL
jgi:hypothetical protein